MQLFFTMRLPVALVFLPKVLFLKKRPCQVKCSFSTYKCRLCVCFFSIFFLLLHYFYLCTIFFFFSRKKNCLAFWCSMESGTDSQPQWAQRCKAVLPWHSCPDDPATDGHHPAVRLTMPITGVGVGYQMVPPGSREELPEGPGFLPQETCN